MLRNAVDGFLAKVRAAWQAVEEVPRMALRSASSPLRSARPKAAMLPRKQFLILPSPFGELTTKRP